jgi:serine/threonine protein kinase
MERATTMRDFVPICKIGEGSFSSVYKVQRLSDNCTYALKKVLQYVIQVKMGLLKQRER